MFDNFTEKYFTFDFKSPCHCLYGLQGPALILLDENGMWFQNQVGGLMCSDARIKGMLIPLPRSDAEVFSPDYWLGTMDEYPAIYDAIDKEMNEELIHEISLPLSQFRIEREYAGNCEAFMLCSVVVDLFGMKDQTKYAVLTWENSD